MTTRIKARLQSRWLRGRYIFRAQWTDWPGSDDERSRSSHRDHHAAGPVEKLGDGFAVHQEGDGRGRTAVDGRRNGSRVIELGGRPGMPAAGTLGLNEARQGGLVHVTDQRLLRRKAPTPTGCFQKGIISDFNNDTDHSVILRVILDRRPMHTPGPRGHGGGQRAPVGLLSRQDGSTDTGKPLSGQLPVRIRPRY